jgi:hypothetical protein
MIDSITPRAFRPNPMSPSNENKAATAPLANRIATAQPMG